MPVTAHYILTAPLGCLAWLANPLFVAAIILLLVKKKRAILWSVYFAATALLCAVSFLFSHQAIPINEGGLEENINARQTGYYLWLISIFTLLVITLISSPKPRRLSPSFRSILQCRWFSTHD